ncbi:MAG: ABC transporter ATP-binding protein [bacterium]
MNFKAENITIGYGKYVVQSELNLSAQKGDLICLTGTNGAGKSTLLRSLVALQPLLGGDVKINDKSISQLSNHQRAKLFALVLTDKVDIENLSVFELVAMGRFPHTNWAGALTSHDKEIIDKAINDVNLSHKISSKINEISDGEKQRAIIAKALAQDTPLILLDEPTAHLDLPNRIEIMMLLRRLSVTTKKTFILSTHELDLAIQMSDRIWLMTKDGVNIGIPEDLMLSGMFQRAFGSNTFSFDPIDGRCHIKQYRGTMRIKITADESAQIQKAWLERAFIRIGINVDENADIEIHCTDKGYIKDEKQYTTIEALLPNL